MKTTIETNKKKNYQAPQIELIRLDNEISLQLASVNPVYEPDGPEWEGKANQQLNNDPYKMA